MNQKIHPIIFILFLFSLSSFGQNIPIKFRHITSKDGLSQATVPCIYKDKLGLMWFGTFDGLNKYDGTQISVYKNNPDEPNSVSNNVIKKIYEDEKYNLWITTAHGLNVLDRKTNQFSHFFQEENNENSLSHNHLTEIIGDEHGNIWIGTLEGYLNKYNPTTKEFTSYPPPICVKDSTKKIKDINYLYFDKEDRFWIGFLTGQVVEFDVKKETYQQSEKLTFNTEIWSIKEDKYNNFWIGTDGEGLKLYDKKTGIIQQFVYDKNDATSISNNTIWSITEDNEGNLLIGTDGGLNILNLQQFQKNQAVFHSIQYDPMNVYGLKSDFIRYIYHDSTTNITWLGNTETGIDIWDRDIQQFTHYHANGKMSNDGAINILNNQVVWSIWDDGEDDTWIGTSLGLNRLNRQTGQVTFHSTSKENSNSATRARYWNILQENKNTYWVGTSTGLNKMSLDETGHPTFQLYRGTGADTISSMSIRSMGKDNKGNFWVGTNKGLNLFDPINNKFQSFYHDEKNPQTLSNHYIRSTLQDKKDRLWIATSEGLNLYNYDSQTFTYYLHIPSDSSSISHSKTRCLLEDSQGQLWIGTSGGLNKMIEQNNQITFEYYTEEDGLPNNIVYAIEEDDDGHIWISSNHGLSRFDPVLETFTNFTVDDGLQDFEFNSNTYFKNKKGELFFGGVNGFNVFHPKAIQRDTSYTKVILTEFRLNNEILPPQETDILPCHVQFAQQINLNYDDILFSIKYAALSYSGNTDKQYAYFLKGWDKNWNNVGSRNTATYTNIPHGTYEFQVKSANKNGEWNTKPTTITINIEPAFWQTRTFQILLLLSVCCVIYYFYKRRIRKLQERQAKLEIRVRERTEELYIKNEKLAKANIDIKNTQAQLLQSEKMASLGQLTAGIAHEINNPINFVAANVHALKLDFKDIQLLLDKIKQLSLNGNAQQELEQLVGLYKEIDADYLKEEIIPLINGIEKGAKRTQNIVTSLRTFSRNANDEFAKADLHEGLESTLTILNSQFRDRINLHKNYGNIPLVHCQMGKINQVFLNIINNAIHAIEGEGDMFIRTEKVGQEVLIHIRDTGTGIEEKYLNSIFDPFFTTKEVGAGTGLGLTISYNIVEQHQGKIEVYSRVGAGTEFVITLPIN